MVLHRIYERLNTIVSLLKTQDHAILRPYGLTPTAFTVLNLLAADPGTRQVDLAARLVIDTSTMTRLIDRLEQAGYVERIANPGDRRALRMIITPDGRSQLNAANRTFESLIAQRLNTLSDAEQQQLLGLLEKLRLGLRADLHSVSESQGAASVAKKGERSTPST